MDEFPCLFAWRGVLCSPAHIMYDINEDLISKSFRYLIQCKPLQSDNISARAWYDIIESFARHRPFYPLKK